MKVYRRGPGNQAIFVGVCVMPPMPPVLLTQVDGEIAEVFRFGVVNGDRCVILEPNQSPSLLPAFMSEAECVAQALAIQSGKNNQNTP